MRRFAGFRSYTHTRSLLQQGAPVISISNYLCVMHAKVYEDDELVFIFFLIYFDFADVSEVIKISNECGNLPGA